MVSSDWHMGDPPDTLGEQAVPSRDQTIPSPLEPVVGLLVVLLPCSGKPSLDSRTTSRVAGQKSSRIGPRVTGESLRDLTSS
jgi:hypothetical protein